MERKNYIKKIVLSAMFLALGMVLPFFTGQIPQIGSMLLPMHIPVFLCGLICGGKYGAVIGFIMPLMRSAIFMMPPMYPDAAAMAFELMAYGFIVGFMYENARWHCIKSLYRCMLTAMLGGRIVWGSAMVLLVGLGENGFGITMFITRAFVNAFPGIILQLVFIPALMLALDKTHLVPFGKNLRAEKKSEPEKI
ncbi:MAG: ECF transporter S component [Oscillospiraceae bacterium]|nr:ECF transporter S component [Oscillospiraceae bacterium]MBQ4643520.1 ECF transporter S component [Oscillospiraceae bacterium]